MSTCSIARLTSLWSFYINDFHGMIWTTSKRIYQKGILLIFLGSLTQLKNSCLNNYKETISNGTLENMVNIETFELTLTKVASSLEDMFNISKFRNLELHFSNTV